MLNKRQELDEDLIEKQPKKKRKKAKSKKIKLTLRKRSFEKKKNLKKIVINADLLLIIKYFQS